jgi:hypothetical protein
LRPPLACTWVRLRCLPGRPRHALLVLLIGGAVVSASGCGEDEPQAPATEAERSVPSTAPAGEDQDEADPGEADRGTAPEAGAEKREADDGAERRAGSPDAGEEGGGGLPPKARRLAERLTNSSGETSLKDLSKKAEGGLPRGARALFKAATGPSSTPPPEQCDAAPDIAGCESAGD